MNRRLRAVAWIGTMAVLLAGTASLAAADDPDEGRVVYHIDSRERARGALRNIRNHLDATGAKTRIVVVANAGGVEFLLKGARDSNGSPYRAAVQKLTAQGVEFRVDAITLKARKIDRSALIPEAVVVPSALAEISRLQAKEGYAYLKP